MTAIFSFSRVFLSTPPSRVATLCPVRPGFALVFLSTPPSRVATFNRSTLRKLSKVSIHATLAGGDGLTFREGNGAGVVSIHATLAGGDVCESVPNVANRLFLSTPPSRVATFSRRKCRAYAGVSIHATLAGGDYIDRLTLNLRIRFLSTPPSRVATGIKKIHSMGRACFYPRHPRGWRQPFFFGGKITKRFLSTPPSRVATGKDAVASSLGIVSIHATLAGGDA